MTAYVPPGASIKSTDRYLSPPEVLAPLSFLWPQLDGQHCGLDPFHEDGSLVRAVATLDCRQGEDAYVSHWPGLVVPLKAHVNGPYSGRYPAHTARLCATKAEQGWEVVNLCPAAPGSEYWRQWVWPHAQAICWLGRLAFIAAVDIVGKDGSLVCPAGKAQQGNRTEIARVYHGSHADRFCRLHERLGPCQTL